MSTEIRQYLGIAVAMEGNSGGYPHGERHALILYVAQEEGAEPDWDEAENIVLEKLWGNVRLRKTGVLAKNMDLQEPFLEMYTQAMEYGSALLIYTEVEDENT
ncbi:hypothetical protein ACFSB1_05800 [Halopseudomonas phragmitis]|uniref:Uncharacterized protein n=1 Tax=Halopseudomonas phragmitis TaxID=1931241 RepID=A0A1V0B892_9GAMM|nr:hypothetical protein [Halopseudomonas phragmitis]AQZ96004.1 hypothetical protein BVH74_15150 [Halopseudomonas phragmitis]